MGAIRPGQGHIVVGRRHVGGIDAERGFVRRGCYVNRERICRRRQSKRCGSCRCKREWRGGEVKPESGKHEEERKNGKGWRAAT